MDTTYYYTRYFKNIEEVAEFALDHFDELTDKCKKDELNFNLSKLSDDQRFMFNHSVKSYYGSTQLLEHEGKPLYVVNEGEYRMMNTLDLTVDQLFFELKMNPWTVRNELETLLTYTAI
jgi:lipopolysaccharide assembly outer membrane protein LptD (OstA)